VRWCDQGRPSRLSQGLASTCLLLAICLAHYPGAVTASPQVGPGDWVEVKKITAPDAAAEDQFGIGLDFEGDTLVVGAPLDDDGGPNSGSVYVFERNLGGPDNWGLVQKIRAQETQTAGDQFGVSLSLHGDMLAIGAYEDTPRPWMRSGSAYIFYRDATQPEPWYQVAKRFPDHAVNGDRYGWDVALNDGLLLVGDPGDNGSTGAAFLYNRDTLGEDSWGLVGKLVPSDAYLVNETGRSVAVSPHIAFIGAPSAMAGSNRKGAVYVYLPQDSSDPEPWCEALKLIASDGEVADYFGVSVSLSGDTIAIGAPKEDPGQWYSGAVYVFERGPGGWADWQQVAKLKAPQPGDMDFLGWDVAIDGDRILAGAPLRENAAYDDAGAAFVFERDAYAPGHWICTAELTASDGAHGDALGDFVALEGRHAFMSARQDDDAGNRSGSVYYFARPPDPEPLFADGFESGDTSAWSQTVP